MQISGHYHSSSNSITPEYTDLQPCEQTTFDTPDGSFGRSGNNSLFPEALQTSQDENVNGRFAAFQNYNLPSTSSMGYPPLNQFENASQGYLFQQDRVQNIQATGISEAYGPHGVNPLQQLDSPSLTGTKKHPQKKRDKLRKSDYDGLSEEQRKERTRDLNNKCSKEYNERKKKEQETLQQEFVSETSKNNDLRDQEHRTTREYQILSRALEKLKRL